MKPKHVLIYLLILAGLAAYVYFGEIKRKETRKAEETKAAKLLHLDKKDISAIEIYSKVNGTIDSIKTADTWVITAPIKTKADSVMIDSYLSTVAEASRVRSIKEQGVNWGEFGLSEPEFTVTVQVKDAKHRLAFGSFNPAKTSFYLRVDDSPQVVLVEDTLKYALNKSLFDLRDKSILAVAVDDVEKVAVIEDGKTTEVRLGPDKKWVMVSPKNIRLKTTTMNRQVIAMTGLQAKEIIDDPQKQGDPYGFDKPALTLEIGGPKRMQKLLIGKPKGEKTGPGEPARYAKVDGLDLVFVIPGSVFKDLHLDPKQLEDRSVCEFQIPDVEKLDVRLGGKQWLAVKGQDGKWKLEKPQQKGKIENRLATEILSNLKQLEWTAANVAAPDKLAGLQLKEPKIEIALSLKGKERPIILKAGWAPPPMKKPEEKAPEKQAASPPSGEKKSEPKPEKADDKKASPPAVPDTLNLMVEPPRDKDTVYAVDGIFLEDLQSNLDRLEAGK